MGMTHARRAREEAERVEREKKVAETFEKERLPKLDALVKRYEDAAARWDGGMGPAGSKEEWLAATRQLTEEEGWWLLMEFYKRRR